MYYGHMGGFGSVGMIIFWGAFIWLIVWIINQNKPAEKHTPKEILKKRLVKGEINPNEYDKISKKLEN